MEHEQIPDITLHRTPDGWMATYHGPYGREIQDLFGGRVLPTAFTARADAQAVLRRIRELNPDAWVALA